MSDQTPKKRGRPVQHQDERTRKMSSLDEMEQQAAARIKQSGRISLAPKLKLAWANQDPNYMYMWASDSETYPVKLQDMCNAGYTFVRHEHGIQKGEPVCHNSKGCNLYLMKQPKELFEEDEKAKHEKSLANYNEIMQVGSREYAGDSKELGKGKVAKIEYTENPDAINQLTGE